MDCVIMRWNKNFQKHDMLLGESKIDNAEQNVIKNSIPGIAITRIKVWEQKVTIKGARTITEIQEIH
jgi:hypothetical protein